MPNSSIRNSMVLALKALAPTSIGGCEAEETANEEACKVDGDVPSEVTLLERGTGPIAPGGRTCGVGPPLGELLMARYTRVIQIKVMCAVILSL